MKQIISIDFYFENLKHTLLLMWGRLENLLKDTFQMPIILNYFLMKNEQ
jgi:hypothetical protein